MPQEWAWTSGGNCPQVTLLLTLHRMPGDQQKEKKQLCAEAVTKHRNREDPDREIWFFFLLFITCETQVCLHVELKNPAFKEKLKQKTRGRVTHGLMLPKRKGIRFRAKGKENVPKLFLVQSFCLVISFLHDNQGMCHSPRGSHIISYESCENIF